MAKHVGEIEGWSHAIGRANRRPDYRPTYGKHGNGHIGADESRPVAAVMVWARRMNGRASIGKHGMSAAHPVAARAIGAALGKRYNPLTCSTAAIQAGIRYRAVVG